MTDTPSPKHVFMSYSRRDEAVMRRVAEFLRKQGINVWVDNEKLVPGTPIWEVEIEKAIRAAGALVVLLSPDSNVSIWVRREISFAERYQKRIFPLLIAGDEDSSIMLRLSTSQYVDIRQNEELGLKSLGTALSIYVKDLAAREQKAREDTERLARQKAEREAAEKAEQERKERERLAREEKARKEKEAAIEKAEREAAERVTREQVEHEATVREPHQKTIQKIQAFWSKYARVGSVIIFLIVVGGIWGISTYFKIRNTPNPSRTPIAIPTSTPTPSRTPTALPTDTPTPGKTETAPPTGTPLPTSTPLPKKITIDNASQLVERTQWGINCNYTGFANPKFSQDLHFMACKPSENSIYVYRVDDGSLFQTLKESGKYDHIAFSPDEQIIASADEGPIRLWDINNGSLLRTINLSVPLRGHFSVLEFSPNGEILAAGELKDIRLFQINDGTELLTIKDRNSEYISHMVFSPDGETLASGSIELRLSRVNDGKLLHKLNGVDHVRSLDISPDGSILASGWQSPNVISLWQISDGNLLRTLSEHIGDGVKALDLDFSPDGQLLASCESDGTIRLWRVSDGTLLNTLEGCSNDVAFSPDGTILASVTDEMIWLWEVAP